MNQNQEVGELDFNGITLEPSGDEHPEAKEMTEEETNNIPPPPSEQLSHRHTRGIPKPTYEPEMFSKVRYPMSNYVSNHRLPESNKSFVNQ